MTRAVAKADATLPIKDQSLFRQQCYINGQWVDADSGKTIEVTNPATGQSVLYGKREQLSFSLTAKLTRYWSVQVQDYY